MYDKLSYLPDEEFQGWLFVHNSLAGQFLNIFYEVLDIKGRVYENDNISTFLTENSSYKLRDIVLKMPEMEEGLFFVRLKISDGEGTELCENLYIFSQNEKKVYERLLNLKSDKLKISKITEGYKIINEDTVICLFLHGTAVDGNSGFIIENNYSSLFPGEEKVFKICSEGCEKKVNADSLAIEWRYLNMEIREDLHNAY